MDFDFDEDFRLATVGAGSVGKTALAIRWIQGTFEGEAEYVPTIEDSYQRDVILDSGDTSTVRVLDTAGQEEYHDLRDTYMRDEEGFMLVFSLTDPNSALEIEGLYNHILTVRRQTKVAAVIVGNKSDLSHERKVDRKEMEKLAGQFGIPYYETSAKADENVDEAFRGLIERCQKFRADAKAGVTYDEPTGNETDDVGGGNCCEVM